MAAPAIESAHADIPNKQSNRIGVIALNCNDGETVAIFPEADPSQKITLLPLVGWSYRVRVDKRFRIALWQPGKSTVAFSGEAIVNTTMDFRDGGHLRIFDPLTVQVIVIGARSKWRRLYIMASRYYRVQRQGRSKPSGRVLQEQA